MDGLGHLDRHPDGPGPQSRFPEPGVVDRVDQLLGESLTARLERWAAAARVDEAASRRSREQWLRRQAQEEGSLAGVLVDLAERGTPVAVHARGGRAHHGTVQVVGSDFVGVSLSAGQGDALVALDAVNSVRTRPGEPVTVGDHEVRARVSLRQVVIGLCAERERALLVAADGRSSVAGTLQAVGRDLVTVLLDGGGSYGSGGTAYVPVGSLGEVILS